MQPPQNIPDYAKDCLQTIAQHGLGQKISLGGAFGLLHYLDYRPTSDVDAWWAAEVTESDKAHLLEVITTVLSSKGAVQTRRWGEVVSLDLVVAGKKVFNFQIASRSAQLQPPTSAQWVEVALDSLSDLVASKMVALIERGAPRDFRDIYAVCQAQLVTLHECWSWWQQRQTLAQSDADPQRAHLAIESHLARISQHRPLSLIADSMEREQAERVRHWFKQEFLYALHD